MNLKAFFDAVRADSRVFGKTLSPGQVEGCEVILKASEGLDITHAAYLLATAYHETAETMQPVRETLASTDDSAIRILDRAWSNGLLRWVKRPYWRKDEHGKSWLGRGYVQLTWRNNYEKAGEMIGVNLVSSPERALEIDIASAVLVKGCIRGIFTGKALSDYLPGDYVNARRVVNGTDKAELVARYAMAFEDALTAADWGGVFETPPHVGWGRIITSIIAALASMFKRGRK